MTWQFDATQYEPTTGIENWPTGWHKVMLVKAEEKPVKGDEPGFYWEFTVKGLEGPVKDKTQFIRINHKNKSGEAMEIAFKTMSAITYCLGLMRFNDPRELLNIPFQVEATEQKEMDADKKPTGRVFTRLNNFKTIDGRTAVEARAHMMGGGAPAPQPQYQPQPQPQPQPGQWGGQPQPGPAPTPGPAPGTWAGQPQPQPGPAPMPAADPNAGQWGGQPAQQQAPTPAPAPGQWGAQPGAAPAAPAGQWGGQPQPTPGQWGQG
jgi:hypothetical protein